MLAPSLHLRLSWHFRGNTRLGIVAGERACYQPESVANTTKHTVQLTYTVQLPYSTIHSLLPTGMVLGAPASWIWPYADVDMGVRAMLTSATIVSSLAQQSTTRRTALQISVLPSRCWTTKGAPLLEGRRSRMRSGCARPQLLRTRWTCCGSLSEMPLMSWRWGIIRSKPRILPAMRST